MPIDASIYGGMLQPQRRRSPLETLMAIEQLDYQRQSNAALAEQRQAQTAQREQEMAAAAQKAALDQAGREYVESGDITFEGLSRFYGPKGATEILTGVAGLQKGDREGIAATAAALPRLPEWMRQGVYGAMRRKAIQSRIITDLPEAYTPAALEFLTRQGLSAEKQADLDKPLELSEGEMAVSPQTGAVIAENVKTPNKQYQSKELIINGQRTPANFDPDTGQFYLPGSTTPVANPVLAPPHVDPGVAATRDLQAQLAKLQLEYGGLTPGQRATEINTLRNQWTKATAPISARKESIAKIDSGLSALDRGNRNAATQIIITAFNKLQDETSVVREGEYARSEDLAPLMSRISAAMTRITEGGGKLTDAELRNLATEAKAVASSLETVTTAGVTNLRKSIEDTLDDYKIPHSRVFGASTVGRATAQAGGSVDLVWDPKTNSFKKP